MISKPLPQDLDAEQKVLGSILIESKALDRIREILKPEDFYKGAHQNIFQTMIEMQDQGIPVNVETIFIYMERKKGLLEKVGGSYYLTYITEIALFSANLDHYVKQVEDKSTEREISNLCMSVDHKLRNGDFTSPEEAIETLQTSIDNIQNSNFSNPVPIVNSTDLVNEEDEENSGEVVDGLIYEGAVMVITAPPAGFKSFLTLYFGNRIASGESILGRNVKQKRVLIIDKETPKREIKRRFKKMGSHTNLSIWASSLGRLEPPNINKIPLYKKSLQNYDVIIFDSLIRFHNANENDNSEMKFVMNSIRELANNNKSIILLVHKSPKSAFKFRGASEILAGCDVLFDLEVLDEDNDILKLSCREKNRFAKSFDVHMRICDDGQRMRFELADSPTYIHKLGELKQLERIIREIITSGIEPTKTNIKNKAKRALGFSDIKTDSLLDEGESHLWKQIPGESHNKKLYELINGNTESRKEVENSVSQFSNTIPTEKQKNWKSEVDPWDKVEV